MIRLAWGFLFLVALFTSTSSVYAATLYMEPRETEMYPGDTLALAIRLDTDEGECINVVNAVLEYEPTIIPVDVSLGQSIVPIWVEEPKLDISNHRISFAGGIPNGYCGRIEGDPRLTNIIAEIIFQAPALTIGIGERDDTASISFSGETEAYLNDGTGTRAPLQTFGTDIHMNKQSKGDTVDQWSGRVAEDDISPQPFSITLAQDKSIFGNRYFITFNTTDKQSGLDHYEIIEEPIDEFELFQWGGVDAPWKEARSPYLLKDQSLNSVVRVKAIDKAGNEYMAVYVPEEDKRGASKRDIASYGLFGTGALLILIAVLSLFVFKFVNRRYRQEEENNL